MHYVHKQCIALPVYFFPEQQFDICCFRSVMKGLLQLMFELRRSFCINICCFIFRINDSRVIAVTTWNITREFPSIEIGEKYDFDFFRYIAISDRDTSHFCAAPWPSFQKVGHVTTRDHWSRDHPIGDPWFPISRFWNFTDISIGHQVIASKLVVRKFCMGISPKREIWLNGTP